MKKLLEAKLEDVMSGLSPGLNALDAALWADARNVHFTPHGAVAMRGTSLLSFNARYFDSHAGNFDDATGLFDASSDTSSMVSPALTPIRGISIFRTLAGAVRVPFGTVDKLWCYNGGSSADEIKTGLAGLSDQTATTVATFNSFAPWGDWFLASNGIDPIQICKDGQTAADLTGSPPTFARILQKLGPHVIAFNTDLGGNYAVWCGEDNVEEWDPMTDVTAGNVPVRDLENEITCVVPLGDNLAIYTENELQIMAYGGAFQFGAKPQLADIGAFGAYGIASTGRTNFGLYFNGIFATDGYSKQLVSERDFGRWLDKNVNWDQRSKIASWVDTSKNALNISIPLVGENEPSRIIVFDLTTKAVSFRDQGISTGVAPSVYRYATIGTPGGKLFLDESSSAMTFDGGPINAYLQTKPLDFGEEQVWKLVQRIRTRCKDLGNNFVLYIGGTETPEEIPSWTGPYSIDQLTTELFPEFSGLYIHLKFQSSNSDAEWTLSAFRLDGTTIGVNF